MTSFSFYNNSLFNPYINTILSQGYNIGVTSIDVQDASQFSGNGFIVIEDLGSPSWEIIDISSISGNTITLNSGLEYPHSIRTNVYYVSFDKIRLYNSSDKSTKGSLVGTFDIYGSNTNSSGEFVTVITDNTNSSGFATLVLYNSVTDTEDNELSHSLPYTFSTNTLQYVVDTVLKQLRKTQDDVFDTELFLSLANQCTFEIADVQRRFSSLVNMDSYVSTIVPGKWDYELPSDINYTTTENSVYDLRLLGEISLEYVEKNEFNKILYNVSYSQLTSGANIGDTVIGVDNATVFNDSNGVIYINNNAYKYTSISANSVTLSESLNESYSSGTYVYSSSVRFSRPRYFTMFDNNFFLYPIPSSHDNGNSLVLDYNKRVSNVESLSQELEFPSMLYVLYLKAGLLEAENYGEPTNGSQQYKQMFMQKVREYYANDPTAKTTRLSPSLYQNPSNRRITVRRYKR